MNSFNGDSSVSQCDASVVFLVSYFFQSSSTKNFGYKTFDDSLNNQATTSTSLPP